MTCLSQFLSVVLATEKYDSMLAVGFYDYDLARMLSHSGTLWAPAAESYSMMHLQTNQVYLCTRISSLPHRF